jgi:hypothetical protein
MAIKPPKRLSGYTLLLPSGPMRPDAIKERAGARVYVLTEQAMYVNDGVRWSRISDCERWRPEGCPDGVYIS